MKDFLSKAVATVVGDDNCSGCGACALVSSRVSMAMDSNGFMRPSVAPPAGNSIPNDRTQAKVFKSVCPGIRVSAPAHDRSFNFHPIFGGYVSAWEAAAVSADVRKAGSSGGVLTALSAWLIDTGRATSVTGVAANPDRPSVTVPVRIMTKEEALASSGSRYAPVATVSGWVDAPSNALIGKPCEVSAAVQLHAATNPTTPMPVTLSFFCAGTPSQLATDALVHGLNFPPQEATNLRYRGNGWPGRFTVESAERSVSMSYEESWGQLGRALQWRCKICVDGTGANADIAVGDFWEADENGFPAFTEGEGNSVAIARTARGDALLQEAALAGVIALAPLSLDRVALIQPLQVQRRTALVGRLAGRILAGKGVPRYRGHRLVRLAIRHVRLNARGLIGTFLRSVNLRKS